MTLIKGVVTPRKVNEGFAEIAGGPGPSDVHRGGASCRCEERGPHRPVLQWQCRCCMSRGQQWHELAPGRLRRCCSHQLINAGGVRAPGPFRTRLEMDYYGDLADALTYHDVRGNTAWASSTDGLRSAALVRGSQALDAIYGARYPGTVSVATQDLLWPRACVVYRGEAFPDDEAPLPIIRAAYELALRELVEPNSVLPDFDPTGTIKRERKKLGPLEKEFEYAVPASSADARKAFGIVDGILADLLLAAPGGTSVTTLVRA